MIKSHDDIAIKNFQEFGLHYTLIKYRKTCDKWYSSHKLEPVDWQDRYEFCKKANEKLQFQIRDLRNDLKNDKKIKVISLRILMGTFLISGIILGWGVSILLN